MKLRDKSFGQLPAAAALLTVMGSSCADHAPNSEVGDLALPVAERYAMEGSIVGYTQAGDAIRETLLVDGRVFAWQREVTVKAAEGGSDTPPEDRTPEARITDLTEKQLAEGLRALLLYQGQEYLEVEPNYKLAQKALAAARIDEAGGTSEALAEFFPVRASSAGTTPNPDSWGTPKTVFGSDGRSVQNNLAYPARTTMVFDHWGTTNPPGEIDKSSGSATMVGASTALSAAHCFWDFDGAAWKPFKRYAIGFDSEDADKSPYGEWTQYNDGSNWCFAAYIPVDYTTVGGNLYDYAVIDFAGGCDLTDSASGTASNSPGTTVGWLPPWNAGSATLEAAGLTHYNNGYPQRGDGVTCGDPGVDCKVRNWGSSYTNNSTYVDVVGVGYRTKIDWRIGHSGSAVFVYADPPGSAPFGVYSVAIVTYENSEYNTGRVIDGTVLAFLQTNSYEF